jgi:hypothetical protein
MTMESPTKADVSELPEQAAAATNERSTIDFPYTDLDNAVEIVKGVHAVGGTACDYEQLAAQLTVEAKGGGFRLRVNGAKTYGLLSYERGGRITLTDLGRKMNDPQQERAARVEAFLTVPLYKRVYEEFKGGPLPPQAGLERAMVSLGVGPKVADRARQVMLRSARQAAFFELAQDRLTAPPLRPGEQPPADAGKDRKPPNTGGSGDDGGVTHPLIQGLLQTLPKPNTPWSSTERYNWLTMANSIFKIIFQSQDSGDVTVEHKPPVKGNTADDLV